MLIIILFKFCKFPIEETAIEPKRLPTSKQGYLAYLQKANILMKKESLHQHRLLYEKAGQFNTPSTLL